MKSAVMQQAASSLSAAAGVFRSRSLTGHSSRDVDKHMSHIHSVSHVPFPLVSNQSTFKTQTRVSLTVSVEALRSQVEIPPRHEHGRMLLSAVRATAVN